VSSSILDLTVQAADGTEKPLRDYAGHVLLIVNVASQCGYTPQYAGLEQLNRTYAGQGLRVLGFPCNDFGAQEPGTIEEIQEFCSTKYQASFDLFDKIHVKGPEQTPLYTRLTEAEPAGDVSWNFEKFLVGRDGQVIGRFKTAVSPESTEFVSAIEQTLLLC
jgi:glutathione peroxidase